MTYPLRPGPVTHTHFEFEIAFSDIGVAWVATTTVKRSKAKRTMNVQYADIVMPAGFVQDAANYWTFTLQNGANVLATYSTLTGTTGGGTLAANTVTPMVMSATNKMFQIADVISLICTKAGSAASLPPGRVIVFGRFV